MTNFYVYEMFVGDINWAKNVTVYKKLLSWFIDWLKRSKIKSVRNDVFCKEPFDRINWRYDNRDFGRVSSRTIGEKQDKTERTWEIEDIKCRDDKVTENEWWKVQHDYVKNGETWELYK